MRTSIRIRGGLPLSGAALTIATAMLTGSVPAQNDWVDVTPNNSPPARAIHAMAYAVPLRRTILFGGGFAGLADTWEWTGVDWANHSTTVSPPARRAHAMAYDAHRLRVVLFGGNPASGSALQDTWEWDGQKWIQHRPTTSPPLRAVHAMAYDQVRRRTVLFGGYSKQAGEYGDTWEWDGSNWLQRSPSSSPAPRCCHAMVYDESRGRVVLFGGQAGRSDTWEWDGTDWILRSPRTSPPGRSHFAMAYDSVRDRAVAFGGGQSSPLFADTWEYFHPTPPTYTTFGTGCPGSGGTLSLSANSLPWIGDTLTVSVSNLPFNRPTWMYTGLSNTRWGSTVLPLSLASIGMPSCALNVSPDLFQQIPVRGTRAQWTRRVPNLASLAGLKFFNQAVVYDPGNNALDLAVSLGGEGTMQLK